MLGSTERNPAKREPGVGPVPAAVRAASARGRAVPGGLGQAAVGVPAAVAAGPSSLRAGRDPRGRWQQVPAAETDFSTTERLIQHH